MKTLTALCLGIVLLVGCGGVLGAEEAVSAAQILSWRKAAEQGDAHAQCNLGVCYVKGDGVAKDNVIAYMWYNLAAASGDENAKHNRKILEKMMTRDQITESERLSREWKPRGE